MRRFPNSQQNKCFDTNTVINKGDCLCLEQYFRDGSDYQILICLKYQWPKLYCNFFQNITCLKPCFKVQTLQYNFLDWKWSHMFCMFCFIEEGWNQCFANIPSISIRTVIFWLVCGKMFQDLGCAWWCDMGARGRRQECSHVGAR